MHTVVDACAKARSTALKMWCPVVHRDSGGEYVAEYPNGRRSEVRFEPTRPRESHLAVPREMVGQRTYEQPCRDQQQERHRTLCHDDDLLLTELRGIQSSFQSEADHGDLVMALALAACLSADSSAEAAA